MPDRDRDPAPPSAGEMSLPIVEETVVVGKARVTTERLRLTRRVHRDERVLDIPVQEERIAVERVPVGRWIQAPVPVRQEGDTTVYPVVEEVVVVETRLRLVEEVRVTRHRTQRRVEEHVALRREEIVVARELGAEEMSREAGAKQSERDPEG